MTELETGNLFLRQFGQTDLDDYAAMCADPEVMRFLGGKVMTRAEAWTSMARILGHWQLRGYGMWALEERATGTFVGRAGFIEPEGWPGFEIGWALTRSSWGRGYATEAALRALRYGFEQLGRDHVISLIDPRNVRSIAVAERLGERFERTIEFFGAQVDVYGIERNAWEQQTEQA